jgi:hypothetical protein
VTGGKRAVKNGLQKLKSGFYKIEFTFGYDYEYKGLIV